MGLYDKNVLFFQTFEVFGNYQGDILKVRLTLFVWDKSATNIRTFGEHTGWVRVAKFCNDSLIFASGGRDEQWSRIANVMRTHVLVILKQFSQT